MAVLNGTTLTTAFVVDDPYVADCFQSNQDCREAGIYPEFFRVFSQLTKIDIQFIQAKSYGTGAAHENDTVISYLRDGLIDFVGPDYTFIRERELVAIQSEPIVYSDATVYTSKEYESSNFDFVSFLGREVFIIVATTVAFAVLSSHLPKSKKMRMSSKIPVKVCFIMCGFLLNLFASQLSVKIAQHRETHPNVRTIEIIRRDLLSRRLKIMLPGNGAAGSLLIQNQLLFGSHGNKRDRMDAQIGYSTYDEIFNEVKRNSRVIGILLSNLDTSDAWLDSCDSITQTELLAIFKPMENGFYYKTKKDPGITLLIDFVRRNVRQMSQLFETTKRQYLSRHQKYWKCQGAHEAAKFTVTLKTSWETSIKSILLYGLAISSGVLLAEFLHSKFYRGR